jgi:hypothetical protein
MEDEVIGDSDARVDGLLSTDLIPAGEGMWSGLLFDNPRIGLAPQLTWTFEFPFRDAVRDYGDTPVSLTLDWIPLGTSTWRAMTGLSTRSAVFGDRGEASVYFFAHHRYASIGLELSAQHDVLVNAKATVTGDIDGLGIESISAKAWLRFTGITVALSDARSGDVALARLGDFTDIAGLSMTPIQRQNRFCFAAATT